MTEAQGNEPRTQGSSVASGVFRRECSRQRFLTAVAAVRESKSDAIAVA
jgi:hypothetical protein